MCMATLADKTGDMLSFVVDPTGRGYGDKLAAKTTGKVSSKLSEEGQRMGFGAPQAPQAQVRQDLQQVQEVSPQQRRSSSSILSS